MQNRVTRALQDLLKKTDKNIEFYLIEVKISANNDKVILLYDINKLNDFIHSFFGRSNFNTTTSVNDVRENLFTNEIEIELNFKQRFKSVTVWHFHLIHL